MPVRSLLAWALLPALACDGGPAAPTPVALGETFELRVGGSAVVRGEGLTVDFVSVASDSRCPVDVVCFWEGDAVVRLRAERPPAERAELELHTSPRFAQEGLYRGYRLRLVGLEPPARASRPIPMDAYVAALVVRRD